QRHLLERLAATDRITSHGMTPSSRWQSHDKRASRYRRATLPPCLAVRSSPPDPLSLRERGNSRRPPSPDRSAGPGGADSTERGSGGTSPREVPVVCLDLPRRGRPCEDGEA